MKIFSWNVNGLRAVIKKGEFQKFIDTYDPDILCIQETKMQPGQVKIDLPEYQEFWNSAERPGYAGTAILVKNGFSDLIPRNAFYNFPENIVDRHEIAADQFGDPNTEGRILTLEFDKFFLVNVYVPNAKDELLRLGLRAEVWDPAFRDYVSGLRQQKPVIFGGDMNVAHHEIDVANPKTKVGKHGFTKEERSGFQNFLDAGFIDSFREIHGNKPEQYTWWSYLGNSRARNAGWRLDYFLVDEKLCKNLKNATIYADQMGSDHCPVSIELEGI